MNGLPRVCLTLIATVAACGFALTASSQDDAPAASGTTTFARVAVDIAEDGSRQPRALQMAIVSYRPQTFPGKAPEGFQVDLIGAVHIADAAYYEELNERFEDYDALLFELVAPDGAAVPQPGTGERSLLSNLQVGMRSALDLEFQLDLIDYSADNFVHADLSPAEFGASMRDRGESLYVYFWRVFYASLREARSDPLGIRDMTTLSTLLLADDTSAMKTLLAYEMADVGKVSEMIDGPDGSTIIAARNQRAMDVLKREVEDGAKRIGIFYGVAHMPDFERRLANQFGLSAADTQWIDAWQLRAASP